MEHIVVYVIPAIIICILLYVFIFKPLLWPFSSNYISSVDNIQEGFGSNLEDKPTPSNNNVITDYEKLYPENLTPLESQNDAINRLLFGDDSYTNNDVKINQINMSSDTPIILRDGRRLKRRLNKNIESFKEGIPGLDAISNALKKIKEGFESIPRKFTELGDSIKNGFYNYWNKTKLEFNKANNYINSELSKIWTQIKNAFIWLGGVIEKFFKELWHYIKEFGISLLQYSIDLGKFMGRVFMNIGRGFLYIPSIFMWLYSNIKCGIKFIVNFPKCYKWYALEVLGLILYTPIAFFYWYFERTDMEKTMWEHIEDMDCKFHSFTGYHLIHYSTAIVEKCYTCCTDDFPTLDKMDWSYNIKWRPVR